MFPVFFAHISFIWSIDLYSPNCVSLRTKRTRREEKEKKFVGSNSSEWFAGRPAIGCFSFAKVALDFQCIHCCLREMTFEGKILMRIRIQLQRYLIFDSLLQLTTTAHYNKLCVKCCVLALLRLPPSLRIFQWNIRLGRWIACRSHDKEIDRAT